MDKGKGLVFAKGDKVNLVVGKNALAVFVQHCGTVVRKEYRTLGPVKEFGAGLPFDDADNDGTAKFGGQAGDEGAEARILKRKGGGGFGPDEEVRLLRAWRRPQAQTGKIGKIDLMLSVPVALILHLLREIRLHDAGKMMRLGLGNKARANPPDEEQRGHDGEQGSNP